MIEAPIRRVTLAEQLAERLTTLITARGLRSGDALPSETKLAAQFGVSRPIMREAMRTLQAQGIIAVANGKGATVRPLTSDVLSSFFAWAARFDADALVELLEVRKGVELQSVTLAAARRTPEEIAALEETVARMAQHLDDPDRYTELDYELHLRIAGAAHNAMLAHLLASIREPFKETIREGLRHQATDRGRRRVQAGHATIVAAIAAGDATAAVAAMTEHLDGARTIIALDQYERTEEDPPVPRR